MLPENRLTQNLFRPASHHMRCWQVCSGSLKQGFILQCFRFPDYNFVTRGRDTNYSSLHVVRSQTVTAHWPLKGKTWADAQYAYLFAMKYYMVGQPFRDAKKKECTENLKSLIQCFTVIAGA